MQYFYDIHEKAYTFLGYKLMFIFVLKFANVE